MTVSVICKFILDQSGMEAVLARLPGLMIVPSDTNDPPQVLSTLFSLGICDRHRHYPSGSLFLEKI